MSTTTTTHDAPVDGGTSAVPPATALKALKLLRAGKTEDFVARVTGYTATAVEELAAMHGWPDRRRLDAAIDELARAASTSDMEPRRAPAPRPVPPRAPTPAAAAPTPAPATTTATAGDGPSGLIQRGKKSPAKRIQNAARRVEEALATLDGLLAEDAKKRKAEAAAKAEEAKLRSEVQRLERELAAKKAALKPARPTSSAATAGVEAKAVRAWAAENGIECPAVGRVPRRVLDAYTARDGGASS
ncbi:histone-like nucleoid-structuring protein Lsr2 [Georgenia sp. MJ206]|uniref:Lsr2 family DNA-binding protein n=1 Tax=Georgenia wangjunii TaxID=3117730 RepID=UPI002F264725